MLNILSLERQKHGSRKEMRSVVFEERVLPYHHDRFQPCQGGFAAVWDLWRLAHPLKSTALAGKWLQELRLKEFQWVFLNEGRVKWGKLSSWCVHVCILAYTLNFWNCVLNTLRLKVRHLWIHVRLELGLDFCSDTSSVYGQQGSLKPETINMG